MNATPAHDCPICDAARREHRRCLGRSVEKFLSTKCAAWDDCRHTIGVLTAYHISGGWVTRWRLRRAKAVALRQYLDVVDIAMWEAESAKRKAKEKLQAVEEGHPNHGQVQP